MKNAILFDWFEFTLFFDDLYHALDVLHLRIDEFDKRCGRNGYKAGLIHNNGKLIVLYDGNEGMGVHFVFSGSCMDFFYSLVSRRFGSDGQYCLNFKDAKACFKEWYVNLRRGGFIKVSRLDVAFDVFDNSAVSCNSVRHSEFKTNWRTFERMQKVNKDGVVLGCTDYYGSRTSDVFLRVYDKKLEQKRLDVNSWVRFEFVLRNKYAGSFLDGFFSNFPRDYDNYCFGLFDRYFTLPDDIMDGIGCCGIMVVTLPDKAVKSIDTVFSWLASSCAKSLNTMLRYTNGDITWLYQIIQDAGPRRDEAWLFQTAPA